MNGFVLFALFFSLLKKKKIGALESEYIALSLTEKIASPNTRVKNFQINKTI